jgi:hydrogenase maturation factor
MNQALVKRVGADKRNWQRLAEAVGSQGRALLGSQADLMAAHDAPAGELTKALQEVARSHGVGLVLGKGKYFLTLPENDEVT